MRYRVDLRFSGVATIEIEASGPGQARELALEMSLGDLARPGVADINGFQTATRDIVALASSSMDDESAAENRPRPSGWYRPVHPKDQSTS